MIIRPYETEDAYQVYIGARDFAQFSGLVVFPENEKDFISAIGRIVTMDGVEILVAEHETEIVGGIGIFFGPSLWNPSIIVGEELFWWAFPGSPMRAGKMLYNEAIKRIEERKAIPVFKSLSNSPKSVEKLYRKDGFKMIETTWMKS